MVPVANVRGHDPKSPASAAPSGGPTGPTGPAAPVLGSLTPNTAVVGGPDVNLTVNGNGFIDGQSVIYFNGGAEPTTVYSPTVAVTLLRPSTATGPWTVPVWVQNGDAKSNELNFSFTEPITQLG